MVKSGVLANGVVISVPHVQLQSPGGGCDKFSRKQCILLMLTGYFSITDINHCYFSRDEVSPCCV